MCVMFLFSWAGSTRFLFIFKADPQYKKSPDGAGEIHKDCRKSARLRHSKSTRLRHSLLRCVSGLGEGAAARERRWRGQGMPAAAAGEAAGRRDEQEGPGLRKIFQGWQGFQPIPCMEAAWPSGRILRKSCVYTNQHLIPTLRARQPGILGPPVVCTKLASLLRAKTAAKGSDRDER